MITRIRSMMYREEGASAVEYGLLIAGIAALVVIAVFTLGRTVDTTFDNVNTEIQKTA